MLCLTLIIQSLILFGSYEIRRRNVQICISPYSQQADKQATINPVWISMVVLLGVVAMLLAGTTMALGIILCRIRKGMRSEPISNLSTHCKGSCINDYLHHIVYISGYVHLKIKCVCVTVVSLFTHVYCFPCLLLSMITQIHKKYFNFAISFYRSLLQ